VNQHHLFIATPTFVASATLEIPMSFRYDDRRERSGEVLPELSPRERANAIVRDHDCAPAPQPHRKFHGVTASGLHHRLNSPRPVDEARQALEHKAGEPLVEFWWENPKRAIGECEPRVRPQDRHRAALQPQTPRPAFAEPPPPPPSPWSPSPVALDALPAALQARLVAASKPGGEGATDEGRTALLHDLEQGLQHAQNLQRLQHYQQLQQEQQLQQAQHAYAACVAQPAARHTPMGWAPAGPMVATTPWAMLIPRGVRLSDKMPVFLDFIAQKKSSRSIAIDYAFSLRIFRELVGDLDLADVDQAHVDTFVAAMRVWPTHASKRQEFRHMAAPEVVQKARAMSAPSIDVITQDNHIARLRSFFRYLEQQFAIKPGLLRGIKLVSRERPYEAPRVSFTTAQLTLIFTSAHVLKAKKPLHWWLAMFGLLTGMRVSEVAQLHPDDIVLRNGIWCISVAGYRDGQRLKNRQSERIIPIHSRLLGAGFLDYLADVRRWQSPTLFPGVKWGHNGPGDAPSDWFTRLMRVQLKITQKGATFHAFRHTFSTLAQEALLSEWTIAHLLGHKTGGTVMREHYFDRPTVPKLAQVIERIPFPDIPLPVYRKGQFDLAFHVAKTDASRPQRVREAFEDRYRIGPSIYGRTTS
jgi:integrase